MLLNIAIVNNAIEKNNVESYCLKHVYFYFLEYLI